MIKAVKLSDDGMLCLSASSDSTLRLWDIAHQKCIKTYQHVHKKRSVEYHSDSIWALDASSRCDNVYTGGKDGNIFKIDILNDKIELISKGTP